MAWPMALAIGASAAPAIAGIFGKKKRTPKPEDFYTQEQLAAQRRLGQFAQTGTYGDFTAGAEVPLGYGDYNVTDIEGQGLSNLQKLIQSEIPQQFRMGDDAIREILSANPQSTDAQFEPFRAQTERTIRDAERGVKRSAAFGGNLYSSDTLRRLGDVNARGVETLISELARLTNDAQNRALQAKLQAIPLAFQSGNAQENVEQNRLSSAFQYGGLRRQLNDASIKARDAELLRRRQELQLPIQASQTLAGQEGRSFPEVTASPYQDLLQLLGSMGGQYLGNEMFMSQYNRYRQPQPVK